MWLQHMGLVLLAGFTLTSGEIFDVTTMYDLSTESQSNKITENAQHLNLSCDSSEEECSWDNGPDLLIQSHVAGRVHVRTNALGLPLFNGQGKVLSHGNAQNLNLSCDLSEEGCSWDIGKDWSIGRALKEEINPENKYKLSKEPFLIGFDTLGYFKNREPVYLYITTGLPDKTRSNNVLQLSGPYVYIYSQCSTPAYYGSYRLVLNNRGQLFNVECQTHLSTLNFDVNRNYISFNFSRNLFQLYNGLTLVKEINIISPELYVKTYSGPKFNWNKPAFSIPVLSAATNGSEMVSPLVMLEDTDELCLTLVLQCPEDSRQDVLLLLAEDLRYTKHLLQAVNNVKVGWNVKQVHVNIEKKIVRPFKLVIRNLMNVSISRISSCNPRGEEVWPLEPVLKSTLPIYDFHSGEWTYFPPNIYKADPFKITVTPSGPAKEVGSCSLTNTCQNGGVLTVEGCVCLPGFNGSECQIGCGPNRFGLDCGGFCSLRTNKMCRDLLMCNSATGCHCAPGYKGQHCHDNCRNRMYGNDCGQSCGHCLSNQPCDIYTGECEACESGYYPPYCKQAYVYYTSKPQLSSADYGTITVEFNPNFIEGVGTPELYQIQFREKLFGNNDWNTFINNNIKKSENEFEEEVFVEERIEGLKTGYLYEVRVLLMDADFNKYDGNLIKSSEIVTKCDVPELYDYEIKTESNSSHITFSWSYANKTEHWCPLRRYEVSWEEGWEWKKEYTSNKFFTLNNLLPSLKIKFRVRAETSGGYAPSSELVASTQYLGSSKVRDLRVVTSQSSSAQIFWNPPRDEDRHLMYKITYKCVQQPACQPGCVNATEGALTQDQTSVTLSPLLPFAQYRVTVTPEDGPESSIYVGTAKLEPTEVPSISTQAAIKTNTSLTVFWDPVPVCSSFLLGYNYHLLQKESDTNKILASSFTKNSNATFHHLTASTDYSVRVFVVTIAGWNPNAFLNIISSTSATVPEAVRNMTVYKRGRNTLGLRWAAPRASYGPLKTFTVSYSLGSEEASHIVELTPCVPWPHLYCHILQGLRANRKYNISVSARNSEVAEDGLKTSILGMTKESPPTAPEGLKLTNSSSTSVSVEWRYPDLANGVIRSFLVSVEETEMFNQDSCCQVYPLVETPVQEELPIYKSEVSGLHPASTYFVSVSAKTVGLGPPQSLVVHTKPPHLPFSKLPQLQEYLEAVWLPQEPQPQLLNNSEGYMSLIKAHILLVIDETRTAQRNDSGIFNPQLNAILQHLIAKPFYFYTEYNQDNLDVILNSSPEVVDSGWGECPSPSPLTSEDSYQLVAAQVSEYSNEFNIDLRYLSETITFDN